MYVHGRTLQAPDGHYTNTTKQKQQGTNRQNCSWLTANRGTQWVRDDRTGVETGTRYKMSKQKNHMENE